MAYGNEKFDKMWNVTSIPIANPAAGAEISWTVPTGQVARFLSLFGLFTASSTVATRVPRIQIKDAAGNVMFQCATDSSVAASSSSNFTFSNVPTKNSLDSCVINTPPIVLAPGFVITTKTNNIQTGDQWSLACLLVELADAA